MFNIFVLITDYSLSILNFIFNLLYYSLVYLRLIFKKGFNFNFKDFSFFKNFNLFNSNLSNDNQYNKEIIFENLVKNSKKDDYDDNLELGNKNKVYNSLAEEYGSFSFDDLVNNKLFELFKIKFIIIFLIAILTLFLLISYFLAIEIALAVLIFLFIILFSIIYLSKFKNKSNYSSVSNDLPYVLRQMGTELKSGKGLHDSMDSIVNSNYGVLSDEFSRVLEEIKYGESTESALLNLSNRIKSNALERAVQQIIITLRIGANLASTLNIIAEDLNFDIQTKLRDYSQKLNAFIMIYTFIAILGPVLILIMILAASTVMGDFISGDLVLILYSLFFPLIIVFFIVFVKRLEPKI